MFDLESPELDAFSKRDVEILTPRRGKPPSRSRMRSSMTKCGRTRSGSKRKSDLRNGCRRRSFRLVPEAAQGRRARRRLRLGARTRRGLPRLPLARGPHAGRGARRRLGQGGAGGSHSAFAAELVRGRTFRRRYLPDRSSPSGVLSSVNTILHQRQLEEYYCTMSPCRLRPQRRRR